MVQSSLKRTSLLYSAILFNTVLGYAVAKLNTNLLSVEDFGRYSFFLATVAMTQAFFSLGFFESASRLLAVQKNGDETRKIHGVIQILTLIAGVVFCLFLYLWAALSDIFFEIKIGFLLTVFAPLAFVFLFQNMLLIALRGSGDINKLSLFTFMPRLGYVLAMLYLAWLGIFSLHSTLAAFLLSIFLVSLLFIAFVKPEYSDFRKYSRLLVSETKSFGQHLYVANIASVMTLHTDKIVLAYYLNAEQLAYYSLAFMITAPLPHFSSALSRSMYKQFANQTRIDPRLLRINLITVIGFALILVLFRHFIVLKLFSPEFAPAINVLAILALAFCFVGMAAPYTMFFKAQKKGKEVRNITLRVQLLIVLLTIILIPFLGINGAAIAALTAYGFDYLSYLFLYRRYLRMQY